MTESLLMQSVGITVIGMFIVFTFLIIMVGIVKLLGLLVSVLEKYFPQETAQPAAAGAATGSALVAVAIAAAKRFQGK